MIYDATVHSSIIYSGIRNSGPKNKQIASNVNVKTQSSLFLYTYHQNEVIKFYISRLFAVLDLLRYLDWYVMM